MSAALAQTALLWKTNEGDRVIARQHADCGHGRNGVWSKRRQTKTAILQVQSKLINMLSSNMDLFSELLAKFQLIQLCSFCSAVIS